MIPWSGAVPHPSHGGMEVTENALRAMWAEAQRVGGAHYTKVIRWCVYVRVSRATTQQCYPYHGSHTEHASSTHARSPCPAYPDFRVQGSEKLVVGWGEDLA
jgi:hypothetical protein